MAWPRHNGVIISDYLICILNFVYLIFNNLIYITVYLICNDQPYKLLFGVHWCVFYISVTDIDPQSKPFLYNSPIHLSIFRARVMCSLQCWRQFYGESYNICENLHICSRSSRKILSTNLHHKDTIKNWKQTNSIFTANLLTFEYIYSHQQRNFKTSK